MVLPFRRHSKPVEQTSSLNSAFVFLKTLTGKQIIIPLIDVWVSTSNTETVISGKKGK